MEYANFKLEPEGNWVNLYPLVCWHLGAPESDDDFIREHIQRIADDPNGWWFYMGDMGECITKHSKGNPFEQILHPEEQIEYAVELMEPIREKGLFGIAGNHGDRVYQETGKSFDTDLCWRLGVPYKGISAFFNLDVHNTRYDVYVRHGLRSGRTMASKVNSAIRAGEDIIADAIITAHSHVAMELEPRHVRMLSGYINRRYQDKGNVYMRRMYQYVCGSAYDSRTGYAEDKGYSPILPAHVCISFHGSKSNNNRGRGSKINKSGSKVSMVKDAHDQRFTIFRADPSVKPAAERWKDKLKRSFRR